MDPLKEYINRCRSSGIDDESIKNQLHVSGYTTQMIKDAFDEKPQKVRGSTKSILIFSPYLLLLVIIISASIYLFLPQLKTSKVGKKQDNSILLSNEAQRVLEPNSVIKEKYLKIESFSFGKVSSTSAITVSPQKTKIIIEGKGNEGSEMRDALGNCDICSRYIPFGLYFDEKDNFRGGILAKSRNENLKYAYDGKVSDNFKEIVHRVSNNKEYFGYIGKEVGISDGSVEQGFHGNFPLYINGKKVTDINFTNTKTECPCELTINDSGHYAYTKLTEDKSTELYVDGKQVGKFKSISSFSLSADGSSYGFIVQKDNNTTALVVNGNEVATLPDGYKFLPIFFSKDGKRFAYILPTMSSGKPVLNLFVDGKLQAELDSSFYQGQNFTFSDDGKSFAYNTRVGDSFGIFLNNDLLDRTSSKSAITNFQFIPKSNKLAYILTDFLDGNYKTNVVMDGKKEKDYGAITNLTFNKDGTDYMYFAQPDRSESLQNGQDLSILVHGAQEIGKNVAYADFSPDGKHYIYWMSKNPIHRTYIDSDDSFDFYLDGVKIKSQGNYFTYRIGQDTLMGFGPAYTNGNTAWFSKDSKEVRFLTKKDGEVFLNKVTLP